MRMWIACVVFLGWLPALTAQTPAAGLDPLTTAVRESYQSMRLYLTASAELMPEANYGFKVTPVSRPFGEWVRHTAEMNYGSCSKLRGIPKPDPKIVEEPKTRAELIDLLKRSFEFCDPAFRGLSDRKLLTEMSSSELKLYPVTEVVGLTNSLHEHYGNLIAYLRSNGVTPPSTLRTQRSLQ
jgi:hypothetical protein